MTVHGDFSRGVIDTYAGVLYQQGRVFLDTDGTAQTLITAQWQDIAARDAFGAGLAAVPVADRDAFKLERAVFPPGGNVTLTVHPGRLWADGLLVRLEGTPPVLRRATYFRPPVQTPGASEGTIGAGIRDAVVLEVWREALSAFQTPEALLEPALGGPDTTERLHTPFAFKLYRLAADESCEAIIGQLDNPAGKGRLIVDLQPTVELAGPCPVIQGGGYTGFEHNLYRIEIADAPGAPRFKWSQYNGGLVGRAEFDAAALRATITANLQAITSSALESFYMEALKLDPDLGHWRVVYGAQVTIDAEDRLVLPASPVTGSIPDGENVFIRLWNGILPISGFPQGTTLNALQDGILLGFEANATGRYTPGDYWTFDVRAGEIINDTPLVDNQPPEGIRYHRVPLGVLEWNGTTNDLVPGAGIEDCRVVFDPLTRLEDCCTFQVGDGVHSHGDFTSIQAAVDALPADGGEVCVLPGEYVENVLIDRRRNVIISGCGRRSRVTSSPDRNDPVFHVRDSRGVSISGLAVRAHPDGIGILLEDVAARERGGTASGRLRGISLRDLHVVAAAQPAIEAHGALDVTLQDSLIEMLDVATTKPAVFFQGEDALIERNVVRVLVNRFDRGDIGRLDRLRDHTPEEIRELYLGYKNQTEEAHIVANLAFGGIQVGGLSERVRIVNNVVHGGIYNGITLGSLRFISDAGEEGDDVVGGVTPPEDPCPPGDSTVPDPPRDPDGGGGGRWISSGPLYDIYIEYNRILDMGLNGIGVVGFFNFQRSLELISVKGLTVHGNEIRRCLRRAIVAIPEFMLNLVGYGGIALAHVEGLLVRENLIRDNGPDHLVPVCGVFLLFGEGVEIDDNRIENNGVATTESPDGARPGARGGVYVTMVVPPLEEVYSTTFRRQGGVEPAPALRLHDNIVVQPLGPALNVTAIGPVSVHANSLTSQGIAPSARGITAFPGVTVTIRNLGLAEEDTPDVGKAKYLFSGIAMVSVLLASFGDLESSSVIIRPILDITRRIKLPSGFVLFSDNQVHLDVSARSRVILRRTEPSSRRRDDLAGDRPSSLSGFGRETMAEWQPADQPSLAAIGPTIDLTLSSIAILSLDDIGFHDNQCLVDIAAENRVLLTQALLFASSLRVTDNRFKEGPQDVLVSGITLGIMNTTALNQATHCLIVRPAAGWPGTVDQGNTILMALTSPRACAKFDSLLGRFGVLPG